MNLSKHFTLADITRSDTATRLGIDNSLPEEMLETWRAGCDNLEAIRTTTGVELIINSGYRSPALNAKIAGSAKHSAHTGTLVTGVKACAFDIVCREGNGPLFNTIRQMMQGKFDVDQLIWEYGNDTHPAWVHIGFVFEAKMRKQLLRKRVGTVKYEEWK